MKIYNTNQVAFNAEIARKYKSADIALMVSTLNDLIKANRAAGKHYHNGRTWAVKSLRGFEITLPWFKRNKINRLLLKMQALGIVEMQIRDHTGRYAFTELFNTEFPQK